MEFHDLEVFLAVIQERSFSRAAERVLRTQPAVSLAIRRLEDELNERLFDRSDKEPVLTDEGEILKEYAERLLNLRNEIRPALTEIRDLQRGRVRIGANETGALFLLKYISTYNRTYPQVKVEIVRCYSRDIPQQLVNRNLDLGVLSYQPHESGLESTIVSKDRLAFVVYPTHPLAQKKKVSIRKLGEEIFVAHNVKSPYREAVLKGFDKYEVTLKIDVELPTVESIKKFVEMGQAVAMIPRMCVDGELSRGELVEVDVPELRVERQLRVVYRKGDQLSHASRTFLQMIADSNGGQSKPERRAMERVDRSKSIRGGRPVDLRSRSSL